MRSGFNTAARPSSSKKMESTANDEHQDFVLFFGFGTAKLSDTLPFDTHWEYNDNEFQADAAQALVDPLKELLSQWQSSINQLSISTRFQISYNRVTRLLSCHTVDHRKHWPLLPHGSWHTGTEGQVTSHPLCPGTFIKPGHPCGTWWQPCATILPTPSPCPFYPHVTHSSIAFPFQLSFREW